MSDFKKMDSLEFVQKQQIIQEIDISFDYYPISCSIQLNKDSETKNLKSIECVYRGNVNHPNITYKENNSFPVFFQANELCVYPSLKDCKKHTNIDIDENVDSLNISKPVLLIKHTSTSSSTTAETIYTCFSFIENEKKRPLFPINTLIENEQKTLELDISPFININENNQWKMYDVHDKNGEKCMFVYFLQPIFINTNPFHSSSSDSFKEGFTTDELKTLYDNLDQKTMKYEKSMECEIIPEDWNNDTTQMYEVPLMSNSYQQKKTNDFIVASSYIILSVVFILFIIFITNPFFIYIHNTLIKKYAFLNVQVNNAYFTFSNTITTKLSVGFVWIMLIMLMILIIIVSIITQKQGLLIFCMFMIMMFIISLLGLHFLKKMYENWFNPSIKEETQVATKPPNFVNVRTA